MRCKRPTLEQKKLLKSKGLIPDNWLVVSDDRYRLLLVHKKSMKQKTVLRDI